MTTITTTQELLAVPEGSTIRLKDGRHGESVTVWTKQAEAFVRDGLAMTPDMFTAALAANVVETGPLFTAGTVFTDRRYEWYVIEIADGGSTAHVLTVYRGTSVQGLSTVHTALTGTMTPSHEWDTRQQALHSAGVAMLGLQRSTEAASATVDLRVQSANQRITRLNEALVEMHSEMDHSGDKARLHELLASHGMDTPSMEVNIRIRVSGVSVIESPSAEYVESLLGGNAVDAVGEVRIAFEHTLDVDDEYVGTEPGDPCEDYDVYDEDWVTQRLRDAGFANVEDVEIERRACSSCS